VASNNNSALGTGDYCSPELLQFHGTTRAADVWALGVFLFEITAGYPPFKVGPLHQG